MIDRTTRLRWRRRIRRSKRQVEDIGVQAEEHLEKHFFKRLTKLPGVIRFSTGWILLIVLLIGSLVVQTRALDNYFMVDKPTPGGTYVEGVLGSFTNANPLYATGNVDKSIARLVFSGVLKLNQNNELVPDLAKDWQVDATGLNYTIHLPNDLKWHDGQPLTAEDIVFTYKTIQNPDAQSPLLPGWQGIEAKATNPQTVVLTLPNPLSSFAYSLTTGIIPKHLLKDVPPDQLRSVSFNTVSPVGAGPFKWEAVQVEGDTAEERQEQVALLPYENYKGGRPKLNKLIIRAFHQESGMVESFQDQNLNGMAGLTALPASLKDQADIKQYDIPLLGETTVFFKTTSPILNNTKLRRALTMGTDRADIIGSLGYPVVSADEPLLKSYVGYDKKYAQLKYDPVAAAKAFADEGWQKDDRGVLTKQGKPLSFMLLTQDTADYKKVGQRLVQQWAKLGVKADLTTQNDAEFQQSLSNHSYDALLYGVELGPDPDVFAYWDSAQADVRSQSRTNFSEYKSAKADAALEAGRTRLSPQLRAIKYQPFLEAWRDDAPGVVLYQPRFLYIARGEIFGFDSRSLSAAVNRYANVEDWMVKESKQPIE